MTGNARAAAGRMPAMPGVLAFEPANRRYFAASVSDRGDDFFDWFAGRHNALPTGDVHARRGSA